MKKIFTERFAFRLEPCDFSEINRICKRQQITRSEFARQAIEAKIKKEENEQNEECNQKEG